MDNFNNNENVSDNEISENDNRKKLKIVKGDSKELNISKVKDSLAFEVSENREEIKENIVVPQDQKD